VKTSLSERDGNTVKLAVEVSSDELQEAFNARLKQLSREVSLPGFRPGKAPLTMVRQRAGDEMILTDAIRSS
jgi:trigger factor